MAMLAMDKHMEVRRMAEQALVTVHTLVDSSVLQDHLDSLDLASDIRTTLLQVLQVLPRPSCSYEAHTVAQRDVKCLCHP